MDKLFDGTTGNESLAFNATMTGLQLLGLLVFAFLGATVSFGFKDWLTTITSYDYWVTFIIMTAEQFYAFNVAYQFAVSLLMSTDKYKDAIRESDEILEGVYTETPEGEVSWVRKPLKEDSALIDVVVDEMNLEERQRLFGVTIQAAINKLSLIKNDLQSKKETLDKRQHSKLIRWAIDWIRKIRMDIFAKRMAKIDHRIEYMKEKSIDKEYLTSLPDSKIPGYLPIDSAALHSNQEEPNDKAAHSKWGMRKQKTYEKKGAAKRAAGRFLSGIFLPLVAWGALTLKGGSVLAMIIMIIMQFRSGWLFATKIFKSVTLYNASQRFKVMKEIQFRIPALKQRIEVEKQKAEEEKRVEEEKRKAFMKATAEQMVKLLTAAPSKGSATNSKADTNTFDVTPKLNLQKNPS